MGPFINIGCTVTSPPQNSTRPNLNLSHVIDAVRREIPSAGDQSIANIVLFMMDTGRISLATLGEKQRTSG
jgi:hypothetical protein